MLRWFPVDQYQNSFYLFGVLDELLQKAEVPFRVEAEHVGVLRDLERRVFLLSQEFPLFSIRVWSVGRVLRAVTCLPQPDAVSRARPTAETWL